MKRTAATLLAMLMIGAMACRDEGEQHDHSVAHPVGHDHHEEGHGHGDEAMASMTLWSERFELFIEHPVASVGEEIELLVHVTDLEGFRALEGGTLSLELGGPAATLTASQSSALRPGIFQLTVPAPSAPGLYRGRLLINEDHEVAGIEVRVFDDHHHDAAAAGDDDDHDGVIEFLKEQQWRVPFDTAFAEVGSLAASVEVGGRIETPPGGTAVVGAPVTGRLIAPEDGLARPGSPVRRGQVLASLAPAPSSPEEAAQTSLAIAEAEARSAAARAALARAERLIDDHAISERELEDARREATVAAESVRAARDAAALYTDAGGNGAGPGTWQLTAPIDGTLVSVSATPGATVSPGESLFRIVDTRELWIVARVPEQDAARLRIDRDASFRLAGLDSWTPIHVTGSDATASVVTVGRTVDPLSRTVDAIYSLTAPSPAMRVGGLVQVSLPAGDDFSGIVVPKGALIDEEGRDVVYVQVDGEHFEERAVRTGPRAGAAVSVLEGLEAGERIVTRGAHLIRLADRSSNTQPHGHIH